MKRIGVEAELRKATGVLSKRGETRQAFLMRLLRGINRISDKVWSGLSEPAQTWSNEALRAKDEYNYPFVEQSDRIAIRTLVERYGRNAVADAVATTRCKAPRRFRFPTMPKSNRKRK